MQCIPSMGRPQLKVKFLSGINHQKSAGLNGAELIYTCPGPASKPLKYKICLFSFPLFFKPLHFYYPLKGTQKCLLVKRIKYLLLKFIPSSFTVIASVCRGHSSPHCKPRSRTETSGNVQRSSELPAQGQGQHTSCWDALKNNFVQISRTYF